jgi:7-cyano-7-deazaguanine reductase
MMTDFNINDTLLGKSVQITQHYDPSVLFRIPRSENRIKYDLHDDALPFVGYDVWNCYEFSFLLDNGFPVTRVMKLIYSSCSSFIVESKSLKLYLNSFNMERFGASVDDGLSKVSQLITQDLEHLLQTTVSVSFFTPDSDVAVPFTDTSSNDLVSLVGERELMSLSFDHFNETPDLLEGQLKAPHQTLCFHTDVLRSNCRVTNQPDWGDLYVYIQSSYKIDVASVLRYLISFRMENHFHEEVVEMIYTRLWTRFKPEKLRIAAMYTRRGGIDINPIRSSHEALIDKVMIDPLIRVEKTLRQ